MSLSGATETTKGYKMLYKGAALHSERSGRWWVHTFYIDAVSREHAEKIARRVFPDASKIVIRKRGGIPE